MQSFVIGGKRYRWGGGPISRMPGALSGFTDVVREDYTATLAKGDTVNTVETVFANHLAYSGGALDTSKNGTYDKSANTIYQGPGPDGSSCLILDLGHDPVNKIFRTAYVSPFGYNGQVYGDWEWRMAAPDANTFTQSVTPTDYKIVPLTWPVPDQYGNGEWDYPENGIGSTGDIQINPHTATGTAQAGQGNGTTIAGQNVIPFHTYRINWTETGARFYLDGSLVRTLSPGSVALPPGQFRWGIQAEVASLTTGTTLAAQATSGATTVSVPQLGPTSTNTTISVGTVIMVGNTDNIRTVTSISGSGPYTLGFATALSSTKASGTRVTVNPPSTSSIAKVYIDYVVIRTYNGSGSSSAGLGLSALGTSPLGS